MIIPDILQNSIAEIQKKINRIKGLVSRVHIDIIDGIFADNLTISPIDLLEIDFFDLDVDLHLLTEEPTDFLAECARLNRAVPNVRAIGQIERLGNQAEFVTHARDLKLKVGLALDLHTPTSSLGQSILNGLDGVLLMSVRAGFSGQKFQKRVLNKIPQLKLPGLKIIIDGGLNPTTVLSCRQAGADQFAVNSWLWQHDDITAALKEFIC